MNDNNIEQPTMTQNQVAEYVARILGVSERQVYDRWVHMPGFPKPIMLPSYSGGTPRKRYLKDTIIEWTNRQLKAA